MKLKISDITDSYSTTYREDAPSFFDAVREGSSGEINICEPVSVDIDIKKRRGNYIVKGTARGAVRLCCSRCLVEFALPFSESFTLTFQRESETVAGGAHEVELSYDDLLVEYFSGDELDISELVQEQLILSCPIKPLCMEECRGLCPKCGANLNETECGCEVGDDANPFSVLKDIK